MFSSLFKVLQELLGQNFFEGSPVKVEKILEDSLDSIPSPSPSVKIQIIGGKVYLR